MNTPQTKNWWDAVVDPASGEPEGYFFGGLIGDIWDAGKTFVSNNPLTSAGAAIGGLTGGGKGFLKGAALGAGGDAIFSPGSYSSQWLGTNGNTGGVFSNFGSAPQAPAGGYTSASGAPGATTGVAYNPTPSAPSVSAPSGATPSAGITGAFGGVGGAGGYAADGMGPPTSAMLDNSLTGRATAGLRSISNFGKANPELTQAGIQLAGGLYGASGQRKAQRMQEDAMRRQGEVFDYNRSVADASNADATQTINDARSTNNPYAMAAQSYAQAQRTGQRAVDDIGRAGLSMGRSPGTVEAEKRRAKLSTSLGATTAYNSGFRTGSDLQRQGVATGNSMRRTISGGGYDASLGNAVQNRANDESAQITALLENFTGNPSAVKKRKDAEEQGALRQ